MATLRGRDFLGYTLMLCVSAVSCAFDAGWADLNTTLERHARQHENSMLTPLASSSCSHPRQSAIDRKTERGNSHETEVGPRLV